jgi:hypothetical protein
LKILSAWDWNFFRSFLRADCVFFSFVAALRLLLGLLERCRR